LTDPPERGAEAPDWFYVPNVPPKLNNQVRRSYVLWQEPAFYGIYEVKRGSVEVYHLVDGEYQLMPANERGHYPISPLGVELGIWQGYYQNLELPWLRWWDAQGNLLLTVWQGRYQNSELPWLRWWDEQGNLLLTGHEQAELERQRAEQAESQLEQERQRAERLAAQLRAAGIEPDV
jgi:hypothetical protein